MDNLYNIDNTCMHRVDNKHVTSAWSQQQVITELIQRDSTEVLHTISIYTGKLKKTQDQQKVIIIQC